MSFGTQTADETEHSAQTGILADSCLMGWVVDRHCCWAASSGGRIDSVQSWALSALFGTVVADASADAVLAPTKVMAVAVARRY